MGRTSKAEKQRIEKFTSMARRFCVFYPNLRPYAYDPGYFFDHVRLNVLTGKEYSAETLELPEWFVELTVELLEGKKLEECV